MVQAVAVEDLCEGLFVVALENAKGRLRVNKPGRIHSIDLINRIKANGIQTVWVDFEQSDLSDYVPDHYQYNPKPPKTTSMDTERKRAESILVKSKDLLSKAIDNLYEGKNIDIAPIADLSESIVDSIRCNPDAIHCVAALRNKDSYLLEHSLNVAFLMVSFGRHLGLNQQVLKQLAIGGLLHDIGKTQVKLEVLNKPARLTPEEFEHMKLHQVLSEPLLDCIPGLSDMSRQVSLLHHEKLDGSGYPRGLYGDEISLVGRMSAIVDIYDALTATRCYKESMSPTAAFNILKSMTPHQLDSELLNEFIRNVGVYPVGSLVELSDERAGLVWESNDESFLQPIVKCFYSMKYGRYLDVEMVNLAERKQLVIERGLSPGKENIDPTPYR
ncbi:HD-GYP domain-containing protein [Photobacterium alginatilyticum]|uniref:HD-GYP domain-containing protein n=1 Tax=Photobacterium alginatilyticum TaxID=1775171 RepID=A0ABW9YMQ2_9GAMM|nr:HD-GYP domain-containing protein [Photobacterium alginatilyticum]NBI54812.1 HD-GYP domain-containing protein [Photobacterium alginatilyticum]